MKAITFHEPGGPEVLKYEEIPMPVLGPGRVVVKVAACALNHLDLIVRTRGGVPMPHITGSDASGIVAGLGDGVDELHLGDPVAINPALSCGACRHCQAGEQSLCRNFGILGRDTRGAMAEYVVVPAANVYPLAPAWRERASSHSMFVEAAAAPLVFMTAWRMLVTKAKLQAGERVLVVGAGGGVATAAIQIAKLLGATIFASTGGPDKVQRACDVGADAAIDYRKADVTAAVARLTDGDGVDVVVDSVGAATWDTSLASLANGGRLVTCGATSGPVTQLDIRTMWRKQITIHGSTMANDREFRAVMGLLAAGKLRPVVDRVFPLQDAQAAQTYLESANQFGKVVLSV